MKNIHSVSNRHPFVAAPNRTLLRLALPVLFSLVAEPMTGLADTAFVARLADVEPVAALGIGTVAFSSVFWVFAFLAIGTQTELAHNEGKKHSFHVAQIVSLALLIACGIGLLLMLTVSPFLSNIAKMLGAEGIVNELACEYMHYRLLGAPAVLITLVGFGAMRGVQDMNTPLYVAVGINLLNVMLDWGLVFGMHGLPAMGVAGAALASTISQWAGAFCMIAVMWRRFGLTFRIEWSDAIRFVRIGGDLFVRTGMLLLFLALCTRVSNQAGAAEGAAYQAIRQFFIFSALFLDAFAITGQSLIGYFLGAGEKHNARMVAKRVCLWSMVTGTILCLAMIAGKSWVAWLLVPSQAYSVFAPAWIVVALLQPLGSLSFATDGIHWGTGDFRYLRNAMVVSSVVASLLVWGIKIFELSPILVYIWGVTMLWTFARAGFGLIRIWPGIGHAPLATNQPTP